MGLGFNYSAQIKKLESLKWDMLNLKMKLLKKKKSPKICGYVRGREEA